MIIINKYGEKEVYCDECGEEIGEECGDIYVVDDQWLCASCVLKKFRKKY